MTDANRKSRKGGTLSTLIDQARLTAALSLIDRFGCETLRILQTGCGTATLTAALVRKGFVVDAIGGIDALVNAARDYFAQENLDRMVRVHRCSYTSIPFDDETFDGVVALDLLPWLKDSRQVMMELTRVLKPGGHLVADAVNRYALHELLDPRLNPFLEPLRLGLVNVLTSGSLRSRRFRPQLPVKLSRKELANELSGCGVHIIDEQSVGFGPVTLFGKRILRDSAGKRIHTVLQGYAARRFPFVKCAGSHHVILAEKKVNGVHTDRSARGRRSNGGIRISTDMVGKQEEVRHEAIYE